MYTFMYLFLVLKLVLKKILVMHESIFLLLNANTFIYYSFLSKLMN